MNAVVSNFEALASDNSLHRWAAALIAGLALFFIAVFLRGFIRRQSAKRTKTDKIEFLEVPLLIASHTATIFIIAVSLFVGLMFLDVPDRAATLARNVMVIACCWQFGIWISTGAVTWIDLKRRYSLNHDRAAAGTLSIVSIMVRIVIWTAVVLLTLDNLGVKITTLVTGLGIGGVAIALAVQNVLGDLLASLSITFDKPFVVGDSLGVDDINGTVEQIGLKTTRIRSVTGEQIIMANADLLKSRVRNYGRMDERRLVFTIGVTYETLHEKLERIPAELRKIIESQDKTRFDRCHFARFGSGAIEFEAVYFMVTADYNLYMDVQQAINLRIHKYFEKEQIEFSQTTPKFILPAAPTSSANSMAVK